MAEWTIETVADRFIEAARTAHRLPPVRVQGYFNSNACHGKTCWPRVYRFPPDPAAIDRMLETMPVAGRTTPRLDAAQRYPWKETGHGLASLAGGLAIVVEPASREETWSRQPLRCV
jgi:hypothetical protein